MVEQGSQNVAFLPILITSCYVHVQDTAYTYSRSGRLRAYTVLTGIRFVQLCEPIKFCSESNISILNSAPWDPFAVDAVLETLITQAFNMIVSRFTILGGGILSML